MHFEIVHVMQAMVAFLGWKVYNSGHCHLVPLWADKLGEDELIARQASRRGGTLRCAATA